MGTSDRGDQPAVHASPGEGGGPGQRSLLLVGTALFLVGVAVVLGLQVGGMFAPEATTDTPTATDAGSSGGGTGGGEAGGGTEDGATPADSDGTDDDGTASVAGAPATETTSGSPPTVSASPSGTATPTPSPTPTPTPTETDGGLIFDD